MTIPSVRERKAKVNPSPERLRSYAAPVPGTTRRRVSLSPGVERVALCAAVLAFFAVGYYAVAWGVEPGRARSLPETALDQRIPFAPGAVYVYALAYTAVFFPAFVVGCPRLFRRTALAYAVAIALALVVYALAPVSAVDLRADPADVGAGGFAGWGVRVLYALDPPTNVLPSLHVALVWLAVWSAWKAWPAVGIGAAAAALAITASTTLVKQHFVLDLGAGAVLAALVAALLLRGRYPAAQRSWRGPAAFAGVVAGLYAAFYAAFRAGVAPG